MDASNGVALNALVDKFNAAHAGKIVVKPIFQGDYDTAITKYKASVQSSTTPSIIQIYDIGTQFMVDSHEVVPIAGFAKRDGYDLGAIQKNIAGTYTVGGTQWSMPLNSSVPLLYYNKTAFKAAGLDPDKPPQNLAEIRAAAEKLSKVNGGPVAYGFGAAIYGWFLEQFAATNGRGVLQRRERSDRAARDGGEHDLADDHRGGGVVAADGRRRARREHRPGDQGRAGRLQGRARRR